jgi:hypothetical protein
VAISSAVKTRSWLAESWLRSGCRVMAIVCQPCVRLGIHPSGYGHQQQNMITTLR